MSPSSHNVRHMTNEGSAHLSPKLWRMSRGIRQPERDSNDKRLQYNANQPASSDILAGIEILILIARSDLTLPVSAGVSRSSQEEILHYLPGREGRSCALIHSAVSSAIRQALTLEQSTQAAFIAYHVRLPHLGCLTIQKRIQQRHIERVRLGWDIQLPGVPSSHFLKNIRSRLIPLDFDNED
ncbi:unnamed protein product [Protopolystoma xenopodis]|uniref:Uncharacterized protein n=1 Tax=Protopolystoma xenopodis TaxID=117903 RepID=A0A448WIM8_9PLAT|nr:unnamed protein product [Protopolystoma xenopodis]